jgi:PAS domain S-box-containing protein
MMLFCAMALTAATAVACLWPRLGRGDPLPESYAIMGLSLSLLLSLAALAMMVWHWRSQAAASAPLPLETLLDALPDLVWAKDPQGVYLACNPTFERLYNASREEIVGKTDYDFVDAEQAEFFRAHDRNAIAQGQPTANEEWLVFQADGYRGLFETVKTPIKDRSGQIIAVLGVARDITERKRLEERLQENRLFLADLIEHSNSLIFVKDPQGRYQLVNRKWEEVAGLSREAVLGRTDDALFPELDAQQFQHNDLEVMQSGRSLEVEEILSSTVNGVPALRYFYSSKFPLRNHAGEITGICGMASEITERKRMEAEQVHLRLQLQQAQKMEAIGQLTGGIAHDFNNILAAMLGYTGLALDLPVPSQDGKLREYLLEVQKAGERARDLIAKMLAFSRIGANGTPKPLAPRALAGEVMKMLLPTLPASIQVSLDLAQDTPAIVVDPVDFQQILTNFVINARDAVGETGRIEVALSHGVYSGLECGSCHTGIDGAYVQLRVADSGHGIPANLLPRIFEPFFTTKDVGKGTGMGLSVAHGLLHKYQGHILVESAPGLGSTFRLLFPAAAGEFQEAAKPPAAPRPGGVPRGAPRILVVDDEPMLANLLGELLEAHGFRPSVFTDSQAAWAAFQANPLAYDAMVTDQTMPGLSGDALTRKLLELRPGFPVILCTGYNNRVDEGTALQAGVRHFFNKPAPIAELVAVLGELTAPPPSSQPAGPKERL